MVTCDRMDRPKAKSFGTRKFWVSREGQRSKNYAETSAEVVTR